MVNPLAEIAISILLTFGLLAGPIHNTFYTTDTAINNQVKRSINEFQKQVRNNGYVDLDTFKSFMSEMDTTKRVYKVELLHSSKLIYPNGTNDTKVLYIKHGNKEILKQIYSGQKYYMRYGDDFSITVTETQVEPSRLLEYSLYQNSGGFNKYLSFSNGGMVENEAN
ncbi:hypothetical protein IAI10_16315 [Clostridium sp. 19966]|uniref:hypothetical protein n=1 Tax=Clostridium sp. 19966 TaxID=2768166 RepID=UPI0028DEA486|nr:hypothetical protein [Clostridium sp. 19966]MDT8718232.1 hypothetical protein [Clostridium sp. 19966]